MRCSHKDCKNKIKTLNFPCKACEKKFCVIHRMPESHNCVEFKKYCSQENAENEKKLMKNKTSSAKIIVY